MRELIQKILWLFSSLVTFLAFLVFLIIGFRVLEFIILPLIFLWLIVGVVSWAASRWLGRNAKKTEYDFRQEGRGETLDIPPQDYSSTPLKKQ